MENQTIKKLAVRVIITLLATLMCIMIGISSTFAQNSAQAEGANETAVAKTVSQRMAVPKYTQSTYDSVSSTDGIGYGIDAVSSKYIDLSEVKTQSSIFDEEWLGNQIANAEVTSTSQTELNTFKTTTIKSFIESFNTYLNFSSSVDADLSLFSMNAKTGFSAAFSGGISKYAHQYFYKLRSSVVKYTSSLPKYSNYTLYRANLSDEYEKAIDDLFSKRINYDEFFQRFGTHVIVKGKYGGFAEANYCALSNQASIDGEFKAGFDMQLDANITNKFGTSNAIDSNIAVKLGLSNKSVSESTSVLVMGGDSYNGSSLNNFSKDYSKWVASVDKNPTLIATSTDGLIGIWNYLPDKYNTTQYKNLLKGYFENYANGVIEELDEDFTMDLSKLDNLETDFVKVRGETIYRIVDEPVTTFELPYDTVNLNKDLPFSLAMAKRAGMTKAQVTIYIERHEVDDGYQDFYLFSSSAADTKYQIGKKKTFSYSNLKIRRDWGYMTVQFDEFNLNDLNSSTSLYFRYGCYGAGEDTWENKNMSVKIKYFK